MKKVKFMAAAAVLAAVVIVGAATVKVWAGDSEKQEVDIIFTHDIHSYIASYESYRDGKVEETGGLARLKTVIDEKAADRGELLLVDSGDITIGTLYQTLFATDALELRLLGALGFDATTLGNHDFDYGMEGLTDSFNAAAASGDKLPAYPICNIDWSNQSEAIKRVREAMEKCNLCDYTIVEKNGVRIAIIGVFGQEAYEDSPTCELTFLDPAQSVQATIDTIKEAEGGADMYVCISHSGTNTELKKSEDEQLAISVPDLDVIVSGHSHTVIDTPRVHGDTYVVSCGCYTEYAGYLNMTRKDDGRWEIKEYELIALDESIPENQEVKELVESYSTEIDQKYLAQFGYTADQVLAENDYLFEPIDDMYYDYSEHNLGNLLSDAYRYGASLVEDGAADVAVVPAGTVRGTFYPGEITVSDGFQAYSLGIGQDGVPGYPLVKFYLTGEEVKTIAEIDASLSGIMRSATLYCSGISYSVNSSRMILNRAYDIVSNPVVMDDSQVAIDDEGLYAIVTDLYTAKMLGSIPRISYGIINVVPKYKDGSVVPSDEEDILWDTVVLHKPDGSELKTWVAIAEYIDSFEGDKVPAYYGTYHGRKAVDEEKGLSVVLKQTNKYFWGITGILAGVVVLIGATVVLVITGIKKKKKGDKDEV